MEPELVRQIWADDATAIRAGTGRAVGRENSFAQRERFLILGERRDRGAIDYTRCFRPALLRVGELLLVLLDSPRSSKRPARIQEVDHGEEDRHVEDPHP